MTFEKFSARIDELKATRGLSEDDAIEVASMEWNPLTDAPEETLEEIETRLLDILTAEDEPQPRPEGYHFSVLIK